MRASIGGGGSARLDRVRPFYEFARDELGEIFRRAAFRRRDVQSQALQAFAHPRQVERVACDLGEAAHDRLGRTAGQEESVPAIGVETGEALLLGGREVRQNAAALGREQRDGLHGLVANERERSRDHVTDVVDATAHEILHGRSRSAIGTWVTSTPIATLSRTQLTCVAEPPPADPYCIRAWLALA